MQVSNRRFECRFRAPGQPFNSYGLIYAPSDLNEHPDQGRFFHRRPLTKVRQPGVPDELQMKHRRAVQFLEQKWL